jgi:uncharacterized protein YbjT (DUF2867 family)
MKTSVETQDGRMALGIATNNLFVREVLEVNVKIGVSGASGHLGRAVVSELPPRPDGHEVVAITRTPETVSGPAQGRFGDYNRPESLLETYAGLDRLLIITTVDPEPGKRGAQHVAAIDAAVRAGVKHIVFMSAAGTRQEEDPALGASYWPGEQHLIATAPAWTILRCRSSRAAGAGGSGPGRTDRAGREPGCFRCARRRGCWGAEISFGRGRASRRGREDA